MAASPIFQASPKNAHTTITSADATAEKTLYTAGATGGLVDSVAVVSDDTADAVINVIVNDGTTSYRVGQVTVLAGAGTDGTTPAQNLLTLTDIPALQANGGLLLAPNAILKVAANSALTATKTATFTAFGGDY
jgi:hypothetical protein